METVIGFLFKIFVFIVKIYIFILAFLLTLVRFPLFKEASFENIKLVFNESMQTVQNLDPVALLVLLILIRIADLVSSNNDKDD